MHGMINRAIERFVRDTYGRQAWLDVVRRMRLDFTEFESMLVYEDGLTEELLTALSARLDKGRAELLEDIGTYLVSHETTSRIRRLLRFSGVNFQDFLQSLDDLPDRVRLALPDLHLPDMVLKEHSHNVFSLRVASGEAGLPGFGHVIMGLLRAMADDYGALVLLDHKGGRDETELLEVHLADVAFAEGRDFDLGALAEGVDGVGDDSDLDTHATPAGSRP